MSLITFSDRLSKFLMVAAGLSVSLVGLELLPSDPDVNQDHRFGTSVAVDAAILESLVRASLSPYLARFFSISASRSWKRWPHRGSP